jgi:NTE family protein|tara:strand:+ start:4969 stop:5730 length:762 start_codon:yes stop_codon:yes gene_type:complete
MEYLVLGPASMGMFGFIGSLKKHENELKNIKEISGSSAGAILGACIALEIPLDDVLGKFMKIDIEGLSKYKLRSFFQNYGLVDMEPVREALVSVFGSDVKFRDLKKKLHISAYNLNRGRTEYFSSDTNPDMCVVDAVCMSMSVPFIAATRQYDGNVYLDGGTKEDIPITPFLGKPYHKVLCFKLKVRERYIENINSFNIFISTLLGSVLNLRSEIDTTRLCKTILVSTGDYNLFKFDMSHDDKLRMFFLGFNE